MPICPNCGSYVDEGSPVCSCGASLGYSSGHDDSFKEISDLSTSDLERELASRYRRDARRFFNQAEYSRAIAYCDKSLSLVRDNLTLKLKANAYINMGDYNNALETFKKCNPEDFEALYLMGDVLVKLERFEDAIEKYKDAIGSIERSPRFRVRIREYEPVEKELERSARKKEEKDMTLAVVYDRIGWAYNLMGEYRKAIQHCERAIYLDNDVPGYWNTKAIVLENMGNYEDALKFYDIAIELGGDEVIRSNRENCFKKHGQSQSDAKGSDSGK